MLLKKKLFNLGGNLEHDIECGPGRKGPEFPLAGAPDAHFRVRDRGILHVARGTATQHSLHSQPGAYFHLKKQYWDGLSSENVKFSRAKIKDMKKVFCEVKQKVVISSIQNECEFE